MSDFLSLILIPLAAVLSALAGMLHRKTRLRLKHLREQWRGMNSAAELKKLLTQIQQHRGMANTFLNGDVNFKYKISALQADIDRQLALIENLLHGQPSSLASFGKILAAWRQLHPNVLRLSIHDSFERHCQLIGALLNLIRDIAEHSQLHRDSVCPFGFVETLWHLLPDTAEAIGQARGLGAGMAAAGRCSVTERIKLGFLVTRIGETVRRVQTGIAELQPMAFANAADLQSPCAAVHARITSLIDDIEAQLLSVDRPAVDSSAFFNSATGALADVFDLYDQAETLAADALRNRLSTAERHIRRSLAGVWLALTAFSISLAQGYGALIHAG